MHDMRNREYRSSLDRSTLEPVSYVLHGDSLTFDNELDGEITPYYVDLAGDFSIGEVGAIRVGSESPQQRRYGMPAKSKVQQKAAGAALAAKRGEVKKSSLKGASRQMVESMTEKELHDMASTPRKGKPKRVSKSS
jgi:hypothetical protein